MTEQPNEPVERGAAEEASDTPITPTEVDAGRRPPSEPADAERPGDEEKELRP